MAFALQAIFDLAFRMVETLVLAVGFFCGHAPLRSIEHTAAPGMMTPLPVPAGCPRPREPLWLELRCEGDSCRGQITQGTEAGHDHAALATIDGPPGNLRVHFTPVEGPLLATLRLSVTARAPLSVEGTRALARVTSHTTVVRLKMGRGSTIFTGSESGLVGSFGPKGQALQVRLRADDASRMVELLGADGVVLLRVGEGARATLACAKAGGICQGVIEVSAQADAQRRSPGEVLETE